LITELATVFRTPLTTIKGSITALMEPATAENREARSALLAETLTAVDRLDSIVENLLEMNRLDSGMLKPKKSENDIFDLMSVVADALRRQSRYYPLSIRIDEDVPQVCIDFILIVQALTNVLLNVARHTPPGTPVELTVERKDRAIRLTVADKGPGVLPEELPNLFGRFFRGKNAGQGGVGLGLSICKGIVEAHGGNISAFINRDGGLSVSIILPDCVAGANRQAAS
jgi:two-component system sensor histidine kinase KdpD